MLHTFYLGLLLCVAGSYALYDSSSAVVELTPTNFDKLVTNSDDVWIVEFFAPWCGHCKNLVPEYQKAAKALKGLIKVGAVDADSHQALAKKYGVSGYPTLKIFTGSKHTPYQGQRTAEAFVDAGIKAAKEKAYENLGKKSSGGSGDKSDVITLTDSNFKELVLDSEDLWLVEFYAPWCGHCKNLEPHWAKAASELKGKGFGPGAIVFRTTIECGKAAVPWNHRHDRAVMDEPRGEPRRAASSHGVLWPEPVLRPEPSPSASAAGDVTEHLIDGQRTINPVPMMRKMKWIRSQAPPWRHPEMITLGQLLLKRPARTLARQERPC